MAYASSNVICKRLKVPASYKTVESLVLDVELKGRRVIVAGLYRPPKSLVNTYQFQLEEEINHFCNWASLQGHAFVLLGDLNLDRFRPDKPEGKLLIDIEETHGLECMITEPTRIQTRAGRTTKTHIDVILMKHSYLSRVGFMNRVLVTTHWCMFSCKTKQLKSSPELSNSVQLRTLMRRNFKNILIRHLGMLGKFLIVWRVGLVL